MASQLLVGTPIAHTSEAQLISVASTSHISNNAPSDVKYSIVNTTINIADDSYLHGMIYEE